MSLSVSLLPALHTDVPAIAKIAGRAFESDRHTQMKDMAEVPYDLENVCLDLIPRWIESKKNSVVKAIDLATGKLLGCAIWGYSEFEQDEIPFAEVESQIPIKQDTAKIRVDKPDVKVAGEAPQQDPGIERLRALTDADRVEWTAKLAPPGSRSMHICMLLVHPDHQRKGVGAALLKWGKSLADKKRVFIWVHSSMGATGAYVKSGFEPVGTLDVDLDEYFPCPPPQELGDGKWGHYIFTYLKYMPKQLD